MVEVDLADKQLPWKHCSFKNDRLAVLVWLWIVAFLIDGNRHPAEDVAGHVANNLAATPRECERLAWLVRSVMWTAIRQGELLRDGEYNGGDPDTRVVWLP